MFKIKRLFKSFKYAVKGLFLVMRDEQNFRVHIIFAILALGFSWFFHITQIELIIVILLIAQVMLMEVVNSAIERVTDILKPRINDFVMEIKDIMAAAVMLSSMVAIIVGLIIFIPYILGN
ncbi:diacylglycerol kinase family protein [Candidatus Parcubacteria bacterium]|nr:diacylglycerol kinase family protein [Patescibacteria group bacterium]MBU4309939.1 diacylglycerol kinase family protein [Patescibacteria group bacterium]MBU4432249.1 diacylglycerol kinase family protein [Patescibacteria group bacterium]MBU4577864.1 diacylglycerol kinase family protein [Patescibacteria group bacterium]MCG2696925.1 diacylglycerol kinase family protein [Candidatus Parcubacteria bacterium]